MKEKKKLSKKGFLFTLLMLIVLGFMLIVVSLYVTTLEQKELIVPEKFKTNAMKQMIDSVSDEKMDSMTSIIGLYAMNGYVENINSSRVHPTDSAALQQEFKDMFMGCTRGTISVDPTECDPQYSFSSWVEKMNTTANQIGFTFDAKITRDNSGNDEFNLQQVDYENMSISYNATVYIYQLDGTKVAEKPINVSANFSIDGMVDLLILERSAATGSNAPVVRQIYFYKGTDAIRTPYTQPSDLTPVAYEAQRGKGWVFGPLAIGNESGIPPSQQSQYILYTAYYDGVQIDAANFSGLVLTTPPIYGAPTQSTSTQKTSTYSTTIAGTLYSGTCTAKCEYNETREVYDCVDCLQFATACIPGTTSRTYANATGNDPSTVPGFDADTLCPVDTSVVGTSSVWANATSVPFVAAPVDSSGTPFAYADAANDSLGNRSVLIDNDNTINDVGDHYLYVIDKLRDDAICGYYVHSVTAPSFTDRLMGKYRPPFSDPDLGIESFVVGEWADNPAVDKVDYSYYSIQSVLTPDYWLKGMPGCKTKAQCSTDPPDNPISQFGLDTQHLIDYGITSASGGTSGTDITCKKYPQDICTAH